MDEPSSKFMSLPSEIRTTIFSHFFSSLEFQFITNDSNKLADGSNGSVVMHHRSHHNFGNPFAILAACHKLRVEALPLIGHANINIMAMYPSWRRGGQLRNHLLGMSPTHGARIHTVTMYFLDSNFKILQQLPNLKKVYIVPPGERRRGDRVTLWSRDLIHGGAGQQEMKKEIMKCMESMYEINENCDQHMAFEVYFKIGFKFMTSFPEAVASSQWISVKAHHQSVECLATALFDNMTQLCVNDISIQGIREL